MMLDHLGEKEAARAVEEATFKVLARRDPLTPDIGGKANTEDMGKAIATEVSTVAAKH
jgi:tartrate dehydrogenase/decarboxylase/D-malate dehydrogenase